ncbi:hypothetical protein Tco_1165909, partial [Tanacetum coccineum]
PSGPTEHVAYEAVHKELGDSLVRVAITASSLEAEQDSGNITKTRSKETPNESSSLGTTSGGGPRCQETMGDTIAQTRLKLNELMELCTNLQKKVLDLEKIKTSQQNEIDSLKRRVKKIEKKDSLGEDASKQERRINAIDVDEDITLVNVQDDVDNEMFDVNVLNDEEVFVAGQNENVVEEVVDAAQDKGKGIMVEEPVKTMKKKDLIRLDEEIASKLQAEFDEEERLAREKAEKEKEANIALIEEWDDIQAKIEADHEMAQKL